jgi:hypothetical protein
LDEGPTSGSRNSPDAHEIKLKARNGRGEARTFASTGIAAMSPTAWTLAESRPCGKVRF